jgi:flavodoxin
MIPDRISPRRPGAAALIAVLTGTLGSISCTSRSADAISAATTALSIPADPVPPGETRVLIIFAGSAAGSTARVAKAIAEELHARVVSPEQARVEKLDDFALVGFGSGVFDGKHHAALLALADELAMAPHAKTFLFSTCGIPARFTNAEALADQNRRNHAALRDKLLAKGCEIVGEFGSLGFNDNSFLKLFGGINKGRPNADDLGNAASFAKGLEDYLSGPDGGGNR